LCASVGIINGVCENGTQVKYIILILSGSVWIEIKYEQQKLDFMFGYKYDKCLLS
jgi:hypothetical protein